MRDWLSIWKVTPHDFPELMMEKLNEDQIQHFINRWHEATFTLQTAKSVRKERLRQSIKNTPAIQELAENPVVLLMMAILNRSQEIPRDRPTLYEKVSEVILNQWSLEGEVLINAGIDIDSATLLHKDLIEMVCVIAYHIQVTNEGHSNLIRREDLERLMTEYLQYVEVSQARKVAQLLIEKLESHYSILPVTGSDSYSFVHQRFLEYFCALKIVKQFQHKRDLEEGLTIEQLKTEIFEKYCKNESWHGVLELIAEMIPSSFVDQIIVHLNRRLATLRSSGSVSDPEKAGIRKMLCNLTTLDSKRIGNK